MHYGSPVRLSACRPSIVPYLPTSDLPFTIRPSAIYMFDKFVISYFLIDINVVLYMFIDIFFYSLHVLVA